MTSKMDTGDLGRAEELPIAILPDEPYWSENFYFVGSDHERGIRCGLHLGRWSKDTRLWREQVMISLPDGSYALTRSVGARPSEHGPSGALLDFICEEAFARWRLRYRGPTRITTRAELDSRIPLADVPAQLLEVDLVFEGRTDVWNFGSAVSGESWAKFHYEQAGRISGCISCGDQVVEFDGPAYRDHSRGPRHYAGLKRGVWMQGHFPGGRSFALVDSKSTTGKPGIAVARIFQDGRLYDAAYDALPIVAAFSDLPQSFSLRLDSKLGAMNIEGTIHAGLPETLDDRNEILYGSATYPGVTGLQAILAPIDFSWDGTAGVGHADLSWGLG